MRHLGIDYGTRRVGLALSDAGGTFASPLEVAVVTTPAMARDRAAAVAEREGVEVVVVGLPLNMDSSEGPAATAVRDWAGEVAALTGAKLAFVDERLSSFDAEQGLIARQRLGEKMTRKGKKKTLDAIVAAGLLQAYLDGKLLPLAGSTAGVREA